MFEARFDKAVEVPWASVLAMNTPKPTPPANAADSSRELPRQEKATEEVAEEPQKTRPVLKRRPVEEPPEVASASKPEPQPAEAPAGTGTNAEAKPMDPAAGGYKLSVKVKMVQVDAVVRDRSGHNMESLRLEDFRVYEDNVLQEVASFSKDELPLAVALVVDRSGSVAPYISELRRIATRALYQLKPQDEVCLFSFAADVQRLEDLTTDRQRIADAIDRIFAGGSTDIMDALYEAIRYLAGAAPDRRHAVILVSDNQQTAHPQTTEREVITTALETEAVVYSLKTSGVPMNLTNPLPSLIFGDSVHKVAQDTGGEVINVSHVGSLDSALSGVIAKLRTRYTLGYYPSSSGQSARFHSITVRLTEKFGKAGSDYFIQAKRGYYAVGPQNNFSESSPLGR
jgi:VWFA-related protein